MLRSRQKKRGKNRCLILPVFLFLHLDILQRISSGKVTLHEDRFYLKPGTQAKLEFNLAAEGLRKIALLWQLIKNGTLERGSVLFWDEPEANINPKYIPVLAELLIMLESEGVQIFVSTHDYFLSKYIGVKRKKIVIYNIYRCIEMKLIRFSVRLQKDLNYWNIIQLWIHSDSCTERKLRWRCSENYY